MYDDEKCDGDARDHCPTSCAVCRAAQDAWRNGYESGKSLRAPRELTTTAKLAQLVGSVVLAAFAVAAIVTIADAVMDAAGHKS